MNETIKSLVRWELKNRFYYLFIEWPENPVPTNMWQDREEGLHYLSEMGLDHLKASIRLVEKDLKDFLKGRRGHTELVSILEPAARAKLGQLRGAFRDQADDV